MGIDERLQAITMNLELAISASEHQRKRIDQLYDLIKIDAENIRALARIAEAHEHRLDQLEE